MVKSRVSKWLRCTRPDCRRRGVHWHPNSLYDGILIERLREKGEAFEPSITIGRKA